MGARVVVGSGWTVLDMVLNILLDTALDVVIDVVLDMILEVVLEAIELDVEAALGVLEVRTITSKSSIS